ncbi:Ig-like domain-containing protein [Clostridium haemolyticum]|uniref:Ig-like domain-containing protein n=1 Tax=Clostridium haemolyticum TaxID=84025 RepID=UPI001FA86336|nr:Ig-like domain-containing protein [Clostridium haemolyticum]
MSIPNKVFASTYKDMGKKSNIVLNKAWDIKFNKDIDETTINNKNIVVVDDKNNNVSINVKYKNSRQVEVSPINNYKPSSNYTMFINEDIKSTDGKKN